MLRKIQAGILTGTLFLLCGAIPARAQHNRYYNGMDSRVRRGDYERDSRDYERRHHHHHDDGGGIGPGKAALIGGAGGAALGAIFGRSLKGSIIGGAAGAGIGAIGGALAQGGDDHHRHHHRY